MSRQQSWDEHVAWADNLENDISNVLGDWALAPDLAVEKGNQVVLYGLSSLGKLDKSS